MARKVPVVGIALAIKVGIYFEKRHLLVRFPKGALVVAVGYAMFAKRINIIAIRRATQVDIRLPYIATCRCMTVLNKMLAIEVGFMINGKMGMAAKQFITPKSVQQTQQFAQSARRIMPLFSSKGHWACLFRGRTTKGERHMITQHHPFILGCESKVLAQPSHLAISEFAGRIVRLLVRKLHIVQTHIMLVATVERIVGGAPVLLPLTAKEGVAILVMIANDRKQTHI